MDKSVEQQKSFADEQIIDMYWNREEQAIQETDRKYGNYLFTIAYNIVYDSCDCEECKNDTYLRVWNAIPPTRPNVFQAFITTVMRNIAINCYKEKISKKHIPSELTVSMEDINGIMHGGTSVEAVYEAAQIGKLINDFVRTLSIRQQHIFIDRFYLAESVEKTAKDLSISVPTVYRHINKIKRDLKLYLERNGVYL